MFTLLSIIMNFVRLLEYELKFFIPTTDFQIQLSQN